MPKHYKTVFDYSNFLSNQREKILKWFSVNSKLSTIEARDKLGILYPSGRTLELREQGHFIITYWVDEPDTNGVIHRVGQYFYLGRKKEANNDV
ncbi:helix-turn-helix domain-containing protein [Rickettsiella massiliensis]|uniref:helix-turn-helix domain-containing protein n=1 Tax=Rickettsiella massiliensis TaxID=676517 RepID=UPI00029A0262|nr:helix-turn-helix domain-containing protein [Rickettsiella massiliensis]